MNDDHTPDLWLLAGDYLDGELDAAEQARTEADPELMAVVAQLRSLRGDLRSAPEPSPGRREAAIVAALATFDELHTDGVVRPIAGRSRSGDRARSATRWLGAVAAAVLVVGGLGLVASQSDNGGDDDAADVALDVQLDSGSMSTSATRAAPEQAESGSMFEAADTASASDMAASVAADAVATGAPEGPAAVLDSDEASGGGAGAPETTSAASALYVFDPAQAIADPGELAQAAEQLLDKADADELVNTPETSCGTDAAQPLSVLSEGLYRTADAVERRIFVAVDEGRRLAVALDPESCSTIAEAPLP